MYVILDLQHGHTEGQPYTSWAVLSVGAGHDMDIGIPDQSGRPVTSELLEYTYTLPTCPHRLFRKSIIFFPRFHQSYLQHTYPSIYKTTLSTTMV